METGKTNNGGAAAGPGPDKHVDALISLFQGCYARRSELDATQWKLNLSIWTAIGAAGWALHSKHIQAWSLAFLLAPPIHAYAFTMFDQAAWHASNEGSEYVAALKELFGRNASKWPKTEPAGYKKWHLVQVVPTVILAFAAIALAW